MLRILSSSALSLLLVVTLFWGGCISCPQFFMFQQHAEKSCCNKSGQCERPDKSAPLKECKRMPLEPGGFVTVDVQMASTVLTAADLVLLQADVLLRTDVTPAEPSPPDLNILHATFLI